MRAIASAFDIAAKAIRDHADDIDEAIYFLNESKIEAARTYYKAEEYNRYQMALSVALEHAERALIEIKDKIEEKETTWKQQRKWDGIS